MFGFRVPMVDARERVTGTIEFVQNLVLPGMLHARVLRSPHAHARILGVDASRAAAAAGVMAVLTGADLDDPALDPAFGLFLRDQPPLARDVARYAGEPVVAVAAETEAEAEAALAMIEVDYEPLPAVLDVDAALAPGAPVLHPGPRRLAFNRRDLVAHQPGLTGTNAIHRFRLRRGDAEAGFAGADLIVEGEYRTPAVAHVAFETHVCVAWFRAGGLTVWSSSQAPSTLAETLAGVIGLPVARVRVIVPTLGGGYGSKIDPSIEPLVTLLARKARRPVRLSLSRAEEFVTGMKHPSVVRLRTGVRLDGTLVAHEAHCLYNGGAYATDTPEKITRGYASMGPYRVPDIRVDSAGVYTNVTPACAFRGFGMPQMAWAHETQMDRVADALGMDPLALRLHNILLPGDAFSTGETLLEDPHYPELLRDAAARIGWAWPIEPERAGSRVRAKGLAAIIKGMGAFSATAAVKLNADGTLNVLTSSVEMGQGALTVLAQIAAHELGVPLADVRVSTPDTEVTPFDAMTAASRATSFMGRAIRAAVGDVRAKLLALAADQLEAAPADLSVEDGRIVVAGAPATSRSIASVVAAAKVGSLSGEGWYRPSIGLDPQTGQGIASPQWHPAVCAAEVEVDEETGRVQILQLHVGLYVGRMVNPTGCELQVFGASLFGVGQALFEELRWDEAGTLTNPNLSDYMIPSFLDLPQRFGQTVLETPGTIDIHGIGETPLPAIAPAVANAVSRAIGARVMELPMTPERILRLVRERDAVPRGAEPGGAAARGARASATPAG